LYKVWYPAAEYLPQDVSRGTKTKIVV